VPRSAPDLRDHHHERERAPMAHPRPDAGDIAPAEYDRWLSSLDPDPRDLLIPFPSEPMTMWPISTRVNKPENDDAGILERVEQPVGMVAK
jgi:putative SOS response-associated peptidase YedK